MNPPPIKVSDVLSGSRLSRKRDSGGDSAKSSTHGLGGGVRRAGGFAVAAAGAALESRAADFTESARTESARAARVESVVVTFAAESDLAVTGGVLESADAGGAGGTRPDDARRPMHPLMPTRSIRASARDSARAVCA